MYDPKIYIVWLHDPHEYGGQNYVHRIFNSEKSAKSYCDKINKKEQDSYSYYMEEHEVYD